VVEESQRLVAAVTASLTEKAAEGQQEEQRQEQHMAARDQKDCGGDQKSN
jgi:hypothetical protein